MSGGEDALVLPVADGFEGFGEAAGEFEFLAEEVDGALIAAVGVVEEGQEAELSTMAAGATRVVGLAFCVGVVHGI